MAFFVQIMIPAGFMPNLSAPNLSAYAATPLVICSGMDMKTIYVNQDGKPIGKPVDQHAKPCAFSVLTPFSATPSMHIAQPDAVLLAQNIAALHDEAYRPDLSLRPPAIGPPTL